MLSVFSAAPPPLPRLISMEGWGEREGFGNLFFFFHWLLPYLLQRDTSPYLMVLSISAPLPEGLRPPTLFLVGKGAWGEG